MFAHKPALSFDSDFFKYATNFFKFCGLWRTDKHIWWLEPYVYFSRFNVYITFGWCFIASVWSGCYLYIKDGDYYHAISWATFSLAYLTMQYKLAVLSINENKIRELIRRVETMSSRYPDKTNIARMLKICNQLLLFGTSVMGIGCIGFLIRDTRILPIKTMFTFGLDVLKSPIYEIYVIYENLGTLVHNIIAITYDTVYIGILLTTSAIIRNLNAQMRKDLHQSKSKSEEKYQSLVNHIMAQIEIVGYLNEIRDLYMTSNLLHFFYNYTNGAIAMLQISQLPIGSMEFCAMMLGFCVEVYGVMTYCEAGQKVTDEMEEFWKILYLSDWITESKRFQKTIGFALLGTQKEYYMAAGKMMTLSRETEKRIMNGMFAYYAFLHTVNSQNNIN